MLNFDYDHVSTWIEETRGRICQRSWNNCDVWQTDTYPLDFYMLLELIVKNNWLNLVFFLALSKINLQPNNLMLLRMPDLYKKRIFI